MLKGRRRCGEEELRRQSNDKEMRSVTTDKKAYDCLMVSKA